MNSGRLDLRGMAGAMAMIAMLACLAAPARAKDWTEVRIASEGARPPYNYLDGNDLAGFEIDLGRELCTRMKVTCTFVQREWDGMIADLIAGQYDIVMAALEINDERKARIDFSQPYVRMSAIFVAGTATELTDSRPATLEGRKIGVEENSTWHAYVEAQYPKSEIVPYGSVGDAILDVAEGRIDAAFGDRLAIVEFQKNRREARCCKLLLPSVRDASFFGEGLAAAFRKSDSELRALFDKALEEARVDGTFAKIRSKYFDFPIQ